MAILKSIYNENTLTERVWYESSSVVYSEFIEHENDNNGELFVTFKNGSTYHYKNVDMVRDYVLFKNGGLSKSQGKALNEFIKKNYEYERVDDRDVELLLEEMDRTTPDIELKYITYFISGHRDITSQEFEEKYVPVIYGELVANPEARFVVGDYQGVDIMSQNYLIDVLKIDPDRITVYHMFDEPRNAHPLIQHFKSGFQTDSERDEAMTKASFKDIAFVRDNKRMSGTAENILRRFKF